MSENTSRYGKLRDDLKNSHAAEALRKEALLPEDGWRRETDRAKELGLEAAPSIGDRTISTFSRGELPHFAGINTFLKAPYVEDVHKAGNYDAAVFGIPLDTGTTYRSGTRFGPQGLRRISALYGSYYFEMGVDLREQMTLCDLGDVFVIPANIEKAFDQISRAASHVFRSGMPKQCLDGAAIALVISMTVRLVLGAICLAWMIFNPAPRAAQRA